MLLYNVLCNARVEYNLLLVCTILMHARNSVIRAMFFSHQCVHLFCTIKNIMFFIHETQSAQCTHNYDVL